MLPVINYKVHNRTTSNQVILWGVHADVIVYIYGHLHTALRTEGNMLDMN